MGGTTSAFTRPVADKSATQTSRGQATHETRLPSVSDRLAATEKATGVGAPGDGDPFWLSTDSAAALVVWSLTTCSWGAISTGRETILSVSKPCHLLSPVPPDVSSVRFSRGCLLQGPAAVEGGVARTLPREPRLAQYVRRPRVVPTREQTVSHACYLDRGCGRFGL